jgi:hypothetical protein
MRKLIVLVTGIFVGVLFSGCGSKLNIPEINDTHGLKNIGINQILKELKYKEVRKDLYESHAYDYKGNGYYINKYLSAWCNANNGKYESINNFNISFKPDYFKSLLNNPYKLGSFDAYACVIGENNVSFFMFQNHYPFNNGVYTGEMDFIVDISDDTKNKYFAMIETKKLEKAKIEEQIRIKEATEKAQKLEEKRLNSIKIKNLQTRKGQYVMTFYSS